MCVLVGEKSDGCTKEIFITYIKSMYKIFKNIKNCNIIKTSTVQ